MTIPSYDQRLGAEDLQWAVYKLLFNNLNAAIDAEAVRGQAIDAAYNTLTGRHLALVKLDRIPSLHFHMGHRPSLIESPPSEWPALTVMTYGANASPSGVGMDDADVTRLNISIECIVHSGPYDVDHNGMTLHDRDNDPEDVVERRIKRTAEAIHATIIAGRDLDGTPFFPGDNPPTTTWGEVFIRDGDAAGTDRKGRYYWQGVRFQYNYDKTSFYDVDQA